MRLWPPTFMNGLQNSINGVDIPETEGSNANKAQALQDTLSGLLGGGASADQGASGGGTTGGSAGGGRAPGPGPSGGGGAGPGGSGGSDGGQGTPGGRSQMETCGKDTAPPAPDRDDHKDRAKSKDHVDSGTNGGGNGTITGTMPASQNNPCDGNGPKDHKGCPPCDLAKLIDQILNFFGGK